MKLTDAENAADGIFFPALEQNMMGAVLINENDEVMFFNPAAEKLWGYKREEVIGNNIDNGRHVGIYWPGCSTTEC